MTTPVAAYDALASGSDAFAPCCVPESDRAHIGYADADRAFVGDADLGLGCGAPVTRAMLAQGEAVLDLGSGGGADAFLAARAVGKFGRVTGVDASESMIRRARERARTMIDEGREEISAVEFRLGELESIPVESGTYDCVISNCVINLCGDKRRAFAEAFRALKPGGRLCEDVLRQMLRDVGFVRAEIVVKEESANYIKHWMPGSGAEDHVIAADVLAYKSRTFFGACERVMKRVSDVAYAVWLAQARHHAEHTDTMPRVEEPTCCTPGPEKKPVPKC
ncbi:SAM-dependent methyltransferase [Ostreococcus tauri]|uniref:Arsenite methyltransferase n=1 Tax=Ostreococcus tauri TaxID=70448 RepID=A0A1Y5I704_OSTTA|nr:SAM-dependent methyltransferase [Ostreococcus tauri]